MKGFVTTILCGTALLAAGIAAAAETNYTTSGSCIRPSMQSVPAGDKPGHEFAVARGTCTAQGQIAGVTMNGGTFAELDDVTPTRTKAHGIFVQTLADGDTVMYDYRISLKTSGGAVQSGKGKFKAIGGTGKMTGIEAEGTCTYTPGTGGATDYSCTGTYTLGGVTSM